jgi:hypothetical protein
VVAGDHCAGLGQDWDFLGLNLVQICSLRVYPSLLQGFNLPSEHRKL